MTKEKIAYIDQPVFYEVELINPKSKIFTSILYISTGIMIFEESHYYTDDSIIYIHKNGELGWDPNTEDVKEELRNNLLYTGKTYTINEIKKLIKLHPFSIIRSMLDFKHTKYIKYDKSELSCDFSYAKRYVYWGYNKKKI